MLLSRHFTDVMTDPEKLSNLARVTQLISVLYQLEEPSRQEVYI